MVEVARHAALLHAAAPLRDPLLPADHLFAQHSALLASALATLAALPPPRTFSHLLPASASAPSAMASLRLPPPSVLRKNTILFFSAKSYLNPVAPHGLQTMTFTMSIQV